ncbi:protein FAM205C isoform X2 [Mastomys coucha]|uniref:protein FAM205C isoform X2 n=1 Tax=Mastomys coucha TaxID=35658 RepID=UPI0012628579|nr:protein FAM205C isoform X2 [Mastomys coucha]
MKWSGGNRVWKSPKCFRRIKQKPSDRMTRAKRTSKEESEKLQKLLSIMKSQGWFPQEGSVRRLLCSDSSCPICNAMSLEIQQLLGVENKKTPSSLLRPSHSFSCLEALSSSKVSLDQSSELSSQRSRNISLPSKFTLPQSTAQKSTLSPVPPAGDSVLQCYQSPQQKQEPKGINAFQDVSSLSSSSTDVPANQQKKRKKTKKLVLKSQEAAPSEAEMENKMTFFSHWVNPEVKCDRPEETIAFPKSEMGAKPETGEPKKNSVKVRVEGSNMEKPANDPKAKHLHAKRNV